MGERSFLPGLVCEDREHETRNYQLTFGSILRVRGQIFGRATFFGKLFSLFVVK